MTSRILSLAVSATLAGAAFFAAPANAEIQRELQLDIQYDSAALETVSGAEIVLNSLQEQANSACRYTRPVAGAPRVDDTCASEIVAKAVMQIDAPELTQLYTLQTGQPARVLASLK
ncbi:MAG: UrcA family protein [Hyphomonas sp.]